MALPADAVPGAPQRSSSGRTEPGERLIDFAGRMAGAVETIDPGDLTVEGFSFRLDLA
jgi:hypothetical protein